MSPIANLACCASGRVVKFFFTSSADVQSLVASGMIELYRVNVDGSSAPIEGGE